MNEEMQAPLERLAGQAQEQVAALRRAQQRVSELTASAGTGDGLVRVEVGAQGQLRALRLARGVYDRMPPEQLADVITVLARDAAADAAERAGEIMEPLLPGGLPGARDWWDWLPDAGRSAGRAW